ncbi:hypothetical protein F5Y05DRAFT_410930 [Hypoxylon sp. FL0543]|nr:hypothetical protein F5Y05DRAFT_410930 [Hypoxylon sp. FL0543]
MSANKIRNARNQPGLPTRGPNPLRCGQCDYVGTTEHGLDNHRRRKHVGTVCMFPGCGRQMGTEEEVRVHIKAEHIKAPKAKGDRHCCPWPGCGKVFAQEGSVVRCCYFHCHAAANALAAASPAVAAAASPAAVPAAVPAASPAAVPAAAPAADPATALGVDAETLEAARALIAMSRNWPIEEMDESWFR